jgi:hypothetical protein
VNYGFGYPGHGYEGGYWRDRDFYYNRTVNNITDVHVTNVYTKTVVNDVTVNRVSYVGGAGGVVARPTSQEEQVARGPHTPPTAVQTQHREAAGARRDLLASVNQGKPAIAATAKPNEFSSHVVSATRAGGPVPAAITKRAAAPPAVRTAPARSTSTAPSTSFPAHVRNLPKNAPIAAPPATATAEEKEYARQQTTLQATQNQERKALAKQQERDHANFARSPGNADQQAAMERQHQQQTQQMRQRHTSEQQNIAKTAPRPPRPPSPHEPSPQEPSSHENPR